MPSVLRLVLFSFVLVGPGCRSVQYADHINPTSRASHVLIIPGIEGPNANTFNNMKTLETSDRSAQVWNWTRHPELKTCSVTRYLEPAFIKPAAESFAQMVREWRREHPDTSLYVYAASGGALVVILAADELAGNQSGGEKKFFDRVMFASASFDRNRNVSSLDRVTESGLYNYYSKWDVILWLVGNAAGDSGIAERHDFVKQLEWRAKTWWRWLDNDGGHLKCNQPRFFATFMEPVLSPRTGDIPREWH